MRHNQSYATYFPAYYLMSAAAYRAGVTDYLAWLKIWRPVCEISHYLIAALLLVSLTRRSNVFLGLFASLFWYFNRWTIDVISMAHLDTSAILLLLLSLCFFNKRKTLSPLLFGCSLCMKQMAVFLVPFYLLWEYQSGSREDAIKRTIKSGILLCAIPLILCLPFLIWSPMGFVKSILFSATRLPSTDFNVKSIDATLGMGGIIARIPEFFLMALVILGAMKRRLGIFGTALLVFAVFIDFNSVLYAQYMVWPVAFIPFAIFAEEYVTQIDAWPSIRANGLSSTKIPGGA